METWKIIWGFATLFAFSGISEAEFLPKDVNLPRDFPSLQDNLRGSLYMNLSSKNSPWKEDSSAPEASANDCPYAFEDATKLLKAIDRMVNSYYNEHYHKISMKADGGIGLGTLWGQLNYVLAKREEQLSPALNDLLRKTHSNAGRLAHKIMDQSIEGSTDPSQKFGSIVIKNNSKVIIQRMEEWKSFGVIQKHFSEFPDIGYEKEIAYPYLDFHCLVSLIRDCSVPTVCQKMYLTDIYSQHMLMNQVIYQQFAEKRNCISANPESFGNAEEYRDRLCSKAFLEAQLLAEQGFSRRFIDLFAEQVGFCGLLGYPNFMRSDWLQEMLSWQQKSKSGCIPDLYGSGKLSDERISIRDSDSKEENEECLVHLTSVTLLALSMNLRYAVDMCSIDIFQGYFEN